MKTIFNWPPFLLLLGIALCSQSTDPARVQTISGPNAEAAAACDKASLFSEAGAYDSALVHARRAAELAENAKDWYTWGKAQSVILEACYAAGRYANAAAALPVIERKAQAALPADSSFWGNYYNAAGAIYNMTGNYEAALKYGLREIAFYEKSGSRPDLAIASNNVGAYYRGRGDFDQALEYTQLSLRLYLSDPRTDPSDLVWTYGNLSKIWYRKKDFYKSIAYAEKALGLLEKHFPGKNPLQYIQTYNDLANAYAETEAYDKALAYYQKALQIFDRNGLEDQIDITWFNVGYVYEKMGRFGDAAVYLKRAIEHYGPGHPYYAKACWHMGLVARRQGDLQGSLAWHQQALHALADSFPSRDVLANPAIKHVNAYTDFMFCLGEKAETLRLLAQKESNPAFLEASLAAFDTAAGVLDSMRSEYQEGSQQFWNREARPIMESAIDLALQLHRRSGDARYLDQAFRYAEKSKALLLAEALRESADKQQAGIPDTLLAWEKQLKIDIAFYKKLIFQEQQKNIADTSRILLWQSEILQRRRAYDALLAKLQNDYPEYYQIKYSHPAVTLAGTQQALPEGTGLLEYFQGDRGSYVFYIDRNRALGLRLATDSLFAGALNRLLDGLRDRDRVVEQGRSAAAVSRYAEDAAAVYRVLVAPAGEKIPKKLIVIPDGRLAYLPFELLLTREARAANSALNYTALPYLLRQTAVRYEYSAGLALQTPLPRHPDRFFAGYAPAYESDWPAAATRDGRTGCREAQATDFARLGNNQAEVTQIAHLVDGQAFIAENATEEQFRQHAQEPRVIHLATHGFLNDCDPLYSGLVFSRQSRGTENPAGGQEDSIAENCDGFLHAYEIYNLRLNAELAVLSACNTGRGQLAKGEGVISLARAFKYAGCANVLMSLWQADDEATAQIMQNFYRRLQQGLGKDAAIRQAKLDYLDSNPRSHPFFWGAFVLIGDDRPLKQSSNRMWYGLGLALLAGIGFAYWKTRREKV